MFQRQVLVRKVREAEAVVRRDFKAIRRVGDRMGLMSAKICFDAWRHWGKERRRQRVRMAEESRRNRVLAEQEKWAAKRLAAAERAKWVAKVDPFTDKVSKPGKGLGRGINSRCIRTRHTTSMRKQAKYLGKCLKAVNFAPVSKRQQMVRHKSAPVQTASPSWMCMMTVHWQGFAGQHTQKVTPTLAITEKGTRCPERLHRDAGAAAHQPGMSGQRGGNVRRCRRSRFA